MAPLSRRTAKPMDFRRPAVHHLIFWAALGVIGWPILHIAGIHGVVVAWAYVFAVWLVLVGVLARIAWAVTAPASKESPPGVSDGRPS